MYCLFCVVLFIVCVKLCTVLLPPSVNPIAVNKYEYINQYRVIHKSVKYFKNSQQIDYSTDHGISYTDRERNSPSFFIYISQMLNVSIFGNTADIYAIVHLVPHACQHITVDQRWIH